MPQDRPVRLISPGEGEIQISAAAIQLQFKIEFFKTLPVTITTFDTAAVVVERCIVGRQNGMQIRLATEIRR